MTDDNPNSALNNIEPFAGRALSKWEATYFIRESILERAESSNVRELIDYIDAGVDGISVFVILKEAGCEASEVAKRLYLKSDAFGKGYLRIEAAQLPMDILSESLYGRVRTNFFGRRELVPGLLHDISDGLLFIDRMDLLPHNVQRELLKIVSDGFYFPIGESEKRDLHVRLVVSCRANGAQSSLIDELKNRVPALTLHSLSKRREDIIPYSQFMIEQYCREWGVMNKELSREASKILRRHSWSYNVVELRKVIATAVQLAEHHLVDGEHLVFSDSDHSATLLESVSFEKLVEGKLRIFFERLRHVEVQNLRDTILTHVERPLIKLALEKAKGNQIKAADILGLNRNTLRSKLKKLGIR